MPPKRSCPERTKRPTLLKPGEDRERRLREAAARMKRVKQLARSFSSARRGPKQMSHMAALTAVEPVSTVAESAEVMPPPNSGDSSDDWVSLFFSGGVDAEIQVQGDRPPTPTYEPSVRKTRASKRPKPPVTRWELVPPPPQLTPIPATSPERKLSPTLEIPPSTPSPPPTPGNLVEVPNPEPAAREPDHFETHRFRTGTRGLIPWESITKKEISDAIAQISAPLRPAGMMAQIHSYRPQKLTEGDRYR